MPAAALVASAAGSRPQFEEATPVWLTGLSREKNIFAGFRFTFLARSTDHVVLRITAASVYRFFVDGQFGGYGPARGPHGWARVDEWDVSALIRDERSTVAIEVAGYNVNSYYLIDQPAFLQAELTVNGKMTASTGKNPRAFEAVLLTARLRNVQRYSFQRPFTEIWRMTAGVSDWRRRGPLPGPDHAVEEVQPRKLLPRRAPYPDFSLQRPRSVAGTGTIRTVQRTARYWKDRSLTGIGPQLGGFPESELTEVPSLRLQEIVSTAQIVEPLDPLRFGLFGDTYRILDFGVNRTGFIGLRVRVEAEATLYMVFDELLTNGDVDFHRLGCVNVVVWHLAPGIHPLETFEPYTLRYLKLMVTGAGAGIADPYLREYANVGAEQSRFECSDARLQRIFEAGRETFRQNAVDLFTDCPSRERAGWLCDSYFTGRAARFLNGHTRVEQAFLENFLLPESFAHLPSGMLPMCYPADHNDGVFIPNWALFLVLQLEAYLTCSGDRALIDAFRPKIEALFQYFSKFRNERGLLEKLESWVFVEWSDANKYVQDVNYPTNLLYSGALDAAGRLYKNAAWREAASSLREEIRAQSFDGEWFVDNAVRRNGKLERTTNRSEVCQYFAFYFGAADPQRDAALWQRLITKTSWPQLRPANAFIGHILRLDLLSRHGLAKQVLDEARGQFLKMADLTGTLWENDTPTASCDHGFASYVVALLYREALGIERLDPLKREVRLRVQDNGLDFCRGTIPVDGGRVVIIWTRKNGRIHFQTSAPPGWTIRKRR